MEEKLKSAIERIKENCRNYEILGTDKTKDNDFKILLGALTAAPATSTDSVKEALGNDATEKELNEPILADNYPIYPGYLYIADGKVIVNDFCANATVAALKAKHAIKEVRRYDIYGRQAQFDEAKRKERAKATAHMTTQEIIDATKNC